MTKEEQYILNTTYAPEDEYVQQDYDGLNKLYFDGKLPKVTIRMTEENPGGFAVTKYDKFTGEPKFLIIYDICAELDDKYWASVLLHEMAHIKTLLDLKTTDDLDNYKEEGGHTSEWWDIVDRLNAIKDNKGQSKFNITDKVTDDVWTEYFGEDEEDDEPLLDYNDDDDVDSSFFDI